MCWASAQRGAPLAAVIAPGRWVHLVRQLSLRIERLLPSEGRHLWAPHPPWFRAVAQYRPLPTKRLHSSLPCAPSTSMSRGDIGMPTRRQTAVPHRYKGGRGRGRPLSASNPKSCCVGTLELVARREADTQSRSRVPALGWGFPACAAYTAEIAGGGAGSLPASMVNRPRWACRQLPSLPRVEVCLAHPAAKGRFRWEGFGVVAGWGRSSGPKGDGPPG